MGGALSNAAISPGRLYQSAGALVLFEESDAITALVERICGEHTGDSGANYCGFAIALIQCADHSDASHLCRQMSSENCRARPKRRAPYQTLKLEVSIYFLFPSAAAVKHLWREQAGERATFVPAQEAPFSNHPPTFVAEYAGLMRRIPQSGATEGLFRETRPNRETFLDVLDQTPKPFEKSRISHTFGYRPVRLIKNLSVYRLVWRAGCC
jgi:hypothetical protein